MRTILIPCLLLSLAACGRAERPEPPTAEESDRLNQADDMLDELANETGPEDTVAPSDPDIRSDNASGR